jgi:hypothetical protein
MNSNPTLKVAYAETKEQRRLSEARESCPVEKVGAVSEREAVGDGPRRL